MDLTPGPEVYEAAYEAIAAYPKCAAANVPCPECAAKQAVDAVWKLAYRAGRRHAARDVLADPGPSPRLGGGQWWQGYEAAMARAAEVARGDQPRTVQPQCSCPLIDTSTNSMKPEFVLGHPAGCPVHGGKYDAARAAAEKRARERDAQTPTSGGEQ